MEGEYLMGLSISKNVELTADFRRIVPHRSSRNWIWPLEKQELLSGPRSSLLSELTPDLDDASHLFFSFLNSSPFIHVFSYRTFIVSAILGLSGVIIAFFFVVDKTEEDLAEEDEKWRQYLVDQGWDGELGDGSKGLKKAEDLVVKF